MTKLGEEQKSDGGWNLAMKCSLHFREYELGPMYCSQVRIGRNSAEESQLKECKAATAFVESHNRRFGGKGEGGANLKKRKRNAVMPRREEIV